MPSNLEVLTCTFVSVELDRIAAGLLFTVSRNVDALDASVKITLAYTEVPETPPLPEPDVLFATFTLTKFAGTPDLYHHES